MREREVRYYSDFTDDFDLYGPLSLSSKLPAYTDRFSFNTANSGVDILGVHFGSIEAAALMAHFDDSPDAVKCQTKIVIHSQLLTTNTRHYIYDYIPHTQVGKPVCLQPTQN